MKIPFYLYSILLVVVLTSATIRHEKAHEIPVKVQTTRSTIYLSLTRKLSLLGIDVQIVGATIKNLNTGESNVTNLLGGILIDVEPGDQLEIRVPKPMIVDLRDKNSIDVDIKTWTIDFPIRSTAKLSLQDAGEDEAWSGTFAFGDTNN